MNEPLEFSSILFPDPPTIDATDESSTVLYLPPPINDCALDQLIDPHRLLLPHTTTIPSPSAWFSDHHQMNIPPPPDTLFAYPPTIVEAIPLMMTLLPHHTIIFAAKSIGLWMMLSKPPPINEYIHPDSIVFHDPATIADRLLLISIVLFSPHPINDFSD